MRTRSWGLWATAIALLLAMASFSAAQSIVSGDLTGTVTDPSGAVVPNATVTVTNTQTGEARTSTTNANGIYRVALLRPGAYTVTAQPQGFSQITRTVQVAVGQTTTVNLGLTNVATNNQTVEVTADIPLIQTDNGNISTNYTAAQIASTPNPGNDITYVAQTAPGVQINASASGGYGNFSSFGLPATSNLFTVNGNDNMDPYLNLNNSGATNLTLGANELQEATVTNNGYTGQFGRQAGANVNYATKSGTNGFHGNAIYWWNGRALNANEWFTKQAGQPRPFMNNNQWAWSFGGPIVKDKTFFFIDQEGLRYVLPTSQSALIPSPQYAAFVNARLAGTPSAAFFQNIFNLYANAPGANAATPVANNGGCGTFTALGPGVPCVVQFRSVAGNRSSEWLLTGRVDHNFSDNDRVFFRYKHDQGTQPTYTDPINSAFNAVSQQPQNEGQLNWTHAFGSGLSTNQFIASGLYYSAAFTLANPTLARQTFPTTISFSGFSNLGGIGYSFPQGRNVSQYQFVDDYSMTRGTHTLKIGANFRRNNVTDLGFGVLTGGRARVTTTSASNFLETFAAGNVTSFQQRFPNAAEQPIAFYSVGVYAQDQWKVTPSLGVTLSLRGDRNSNPVCQSNCFSRLVAPFQTLTATQNVNTPYNQAIRTGLRRAFPSFEAVAWQPRIGFAYTPFQNGPVLRGGFGLFSDLYPGTLVSRFARNIPNLNEFTVRNLPLAPDVPGNAFATAALVNQVFTSQFFNGGTLASIQGAMPAGFTFSPPAVNAVNADMTNPKFAEWNLEVQQPIGNRMALTVNYVGNHGYDIFVFNPGANAANCSLRTATAGTCGALTPGAAFAGLPLTPPDPRFGNVVDVRNRGVSNYNGLTTTFSRRGSQLNFNASYTWSHTLDEVSNGGVLPYNLDNSVTVQIDPRNLRRFNYGNADYDARHYGSVNYSWTPGVNFSNRIMRGAIGGWTIGQTFFVRSGMPFTVLDLSAPFGLVNFTTGVIPAGLTGVPQQTCDTPNRPCLTGAEIANLANAGSATAFGNQRRNQFRGPMFWNSDLQVSKTFKVTEQVGLGVGANFFNLFNHPNFANPDFDISSPTFGTILSTVTPPTSPYGAFVGSATSPRIIQMQAKVTF